MTVSLRPYQQTMLDQTRAHLAAGHRAVLIQAPTGSGKTVLVAYMVLTAASRGRRTWFIVHRRELIKQSARTFEDVGVKHGVVGAGWKMQAMRQVQICGVQTLAHRLDLLPAPDLIVWDECHHVAAKSWAAIHARYPRAFHIGLTATPERLDGEGLGRFFDQMVLGPSTADLIEAEFLSPFKYYAPAAAGIDALGMSMGDFDRRQAMALMDKPSITGDAISHYRRLASGKRAVVFAVKREHSRHMVEDFNAAGIPAEHVDGETPAAQRDAAVERFGTGETLVLSNVDLFGEGFDLPAIEVAILMRPTQSLALYLQQIGRALRPYPGKSHAVILDHAGNVTRFGMPDEPRVWKLDQEKRKRGTKGAIPVRICPKCFAACPAASVKCPQCGTVFPIAGREVEEVEGELAEITPEQRVAMRREQGQAGTLGELIEVARRRGYRNPAGWAMHVLAGRRKKMEVA